LASERLLAVQQGGAGVTRIGHHTARCGRPANRFRPAT